MVEHAVSQDALVGRKLGHYRIAEKIGAGGMGEVYRAHDEHLEREIAIKVLPGGTLADEQSRKRFHKEALALSKLNHPNIATIHDFDTQQGVDFLVMEYVPGVTLSERLADRPLVEKEVIRLGAQLAEGLSVAHEHGVIHRDLKPGNLRQTPDGWLKILDFGLAKLRLPVTSTAGTESLSETQALSGTLSYMAPEQLLGGEIDARTDIHAAGAVLYEMATGRRPFAEVEQLQVIGAILQRPPQPPSSVNPRVSPELERIIGKCLEKEPENRYQSAKELAVDLRRMGAPSASTAVRATEAKRLGRIAKAIMVGVAVLVVAGVSLIAFNAGGWRDRWFGGTASPQINSLAVLPLANFSHDPEQDYFADGMTEALITDLAKISALKVISRTSVMRYKGSAKPLPDVARELNVDGIIEGSVQRVGGRVRITAQLIQASSDTHLWAESYERDLRDVLALQGEVAEAIARQISAKVSSGGRLPRTIQPVNPKAYEAYLKGRYYTARITPEAEQRAIEYLQEAIRLSPDYAPAYSALADTYFMLGVPLGPDSQAEARQYLSQSQAAARKALALDDSLAEAHARLGESSLFRDWDWDTAQREVQRALELDPNCLYALYARAVNLTMMGRHEESRRTMRKALELDPVNATTRTLAGELLLDARSYDEAETELRQVVEMDPTYSRAHEVLTMLREARGQGEEAANEYTKAGLLAPEEAADLARAFRAEGMHGFYARFLETIQRRQVRPIHFARIYAGLGDRERTLHYLKKAVQERDSQLLFCKAFPWLDPLRSDPRFQDLVRRLNLPQ